MKDTFLSAWRSWLIRPKQWLINISVAVLLVIIIVFWVWMYQSVYTLFASKRVQPVPSQPVPVQTQFMPGTPENPIGTPEDFMKAYENLERTRREQAFAAFGSGVYLNIGRGWHPCSEMQWNQYSDVHPNIEGTVFSSDETKYSWGNLSVPVIRMRFSKAICGSGVNSEPSVYLYPLKRTDETNPLDGYVGGSNNQTYGQVVAGEGTEADYLIEVPVPPSSTGRYVLEFRPWFLLLVCSTPSIINHGGYNNP